MPVADRAKTHTVCASKQHARRSPWRVFQHPENVHGGIGEQAREPSVSAFEIRAPGFGHTSKATSDALLKPLVKKLVALLGLGG